MAGSIVRLKQQSRFNSPDLGAKAASEETMLNKALRHLPLSVVSGSVARVSTSKDHRNPIIGARITDDFFAARNAHRIVAVVYSIWSGPAWNASL
jgi:hypothetical protein